MYVNSAFFNKVKFTINISLNRIGMGVVEIWCLLFDCSFLHCKLSRYPVVWLQDSLMLAQRSRIHIATDIYSQVRDVLTLQKVDRYRTGGEGVSMKLTINLH